MKTAVLVSGLPRFNYINNVDRIPLAFPNADIFYQTWKGQTYDKTKLKNVLLTPEPKVDYVAYDTQQHMPFRRIRNHNQLVGIWRNLAYNRVKQIIAHADLLSTIPEEYDMIVRVRYDSKLSYLKESIDHFQKSMEKSYEEDVSIGYGYQFHLGINVKLYGSSTPSWENITPATQSTFYEGKYHHSDHMMIHKRSLFDCDKVYSLHKNKALFPAETGWWQVLCYRKKTCICYNGGVLLDNKI